MDVRAARQVLGTERVLAQTTEDPEVNGRAPTVGCEIVSPTSDASLTVEVLTPAGAELAKKRAALTGAKPALNPACEHPRIITGTGMVGVVCDGDTHHGVRLVACFDEHEVTADLVLEDPPTDATYAALQKIVAAADAQHG